MPSAAEILEGLATIANSWQKLAGFWHIYFGLFAVAASIGWRPPSRLAGALLIPPMVSVCVLALVEGNPFNGMLFGRLSIVLVVLLRGLSITPVERASRIWIVLGSLLFGFGWVYPHFLEGEWGLAYLYAAPLGLVPCPTLSMAAGIAIILSGFRSRVWSLVLTVTALFYGIFGSLYLGVTIDWVLTGGGVTLLILSMSQAVGGNPRAA
jgi:hypothetical protein